MNFRSSGFKYVAVLFAIWLPLSAASSVERSPRPGVGAKEAAREISSSADYVLQPQDVLRVHVFQHEDINKQCEAVSVSQEHTINLPLIGTVTVKGKTARQAEAMIGALYDKDYLVKPQVSVQVMKYAERFVNVVGAVNDAGRIPFPQEGGLTILDAISKAGGPNRLADLKRVKLTRKGADGESTMQEINVDTLMKNGGRGAVQLEKDDSIFVPERIL